MKGVEKRILVASLLVGPLLFGCATTGRQPATWAAGRPQEQQQFFTELDKTVEAYRVREASSFPVPGFPYLRTDRFLWSLEDGIDAGTQQAWIESMRQLDRKARRKEIRNLPDAALRELTKSLQVGLDRQQLAARVDLASEQLLASDRQQSEFLTAVKESVTVAGEYVTTMRIFGVYPVAAIPVTAATKNQYDVFRQWHRTPPERLQVDGHLTVFTSAGSGTGSRRELQGLFAPSRRNALGVPELSPEERKNLVMAYAPVIEQDVVGIYDLFGKVKWRNGRVKIDADNPTVYYYITYSRLKGEPVLQIPRLEVRKRETLTLVGYNGSGKSTLLRVLGLLLRPTSGVSRCGRWPASPRGRVHADLSDQEST